MAACLKCGGTGEHFDHEKDDWVSPMEDCPDCEGTGLEEVRLLKKRDGVENNG